MSRTFPYVSRNQFSFHISICKWSCEKANKAHTRPNLCIKKVIKYMIKMTILLLLRIIGNGVNAVKTLHN